MVVSALGQRTPSTAALVEAGAPMWAQRMALKFIGFFQALHPRQPSEVWRVNKADLPPAADWLGCVVVVQDQACLGVSDGTNWRKIAYGGPV